MQNREADQERDSDFQSRMSLLSEIPSGKTELLPNRPSAKTAKRCDASIF